MKTNRNLLKEAIADAKAVKETAIANAKAALEEAFTPHLKELFASKLEEMELDEEAEEVDEMMTDNEMEEAKVKETSKMKEEMDLEELLAELNEAEEEGEAEEKEEEGEAEEEAEEEVEVSEMSEDDLKTFIEDVIKDMVSAGELEAGEKEAEAGTEEAEMMEEDLDEEINLEELLAEVEKEKMEEAEINESLTPEMIAALSALGIPVVAGAVATATDAIEKAAAKGNKTAAAIDKLIKSMGKIGSAGKAGIKEETVELQEAYSTIKTLKRELHEINLLNAKLLYTNKIFKAKNLTDPQKVKVLENFDKATTVNEVKLVFETLTENLNNNKTTVNESKMRGFASKTIAPVVNKKQPIIESNDAFARMQRLAGLR
jgi:hypothetical protein